jgi:tRNA (mo5U34)-methyltransferase
MTRDEMLTQLNGLAPFLHRVNLPHGLNTHDPKGTGQPEGRLRTQNLIDFVWPRLLSHFGGSFKGLRVLDIACNCGGFSFEAAKSGAADVYGIDVVDRYIDQANFIKGAIGADKVRFEKRSLDDLDPARDGMFDLVFCFGILYHLENPVASMRKVAAVTKSVMLVETNIFVTESDLPVWRMKVSGGPKDDTDVTSLWRADEGVCQFVPNPLAVIALLQFLKFPNVEFLKPAGKIMDEPRYREGRRGAFLAIRP